MRIAVVVARFPEVSETFILNQIVGLIRLGHQVDIVAFHPAKVRRETIHGNVRKYGLLEHTKYLSIPRSRLARAVSALGIILRYGFRYAGILKRVMDSRNCKRHEVIDRLFKAEPFLRKPYDIVHCHFGPIANRMIFVKDCFPEMSFIVTFHGYDVLREKTGEGEVYRELFRKADRVISICDYTRRRLLSYGCPEEKIASCPNGICLEKFSVQKAVISRGVFRITTAARLVEEKNIFFALRIMKALKERGDIPFRYHLIGDGPLADAVRRMVRENDLEDVVVLHGAESQEAFVDHLRKTDVFLLTSKNEAFGIVLLEAQACGVPVVATDVGGVKNAFVDGQTGFLIPLDDLETAVTVLTDLYGDEDLRQRMGKAGRIFVGQHYNIREHTLQLEKIYLSCRRI